MIMRGQRIIVFLYFQVLPVFLKLYAAMLRKISLLIPDEIRVGPIRGGYSIENAMCIPNSGVENFQLVRRGISVTQDMPISFDGSLPHWKFRELEQYEYPDAYVVEICNGHIFGLHGAVITPDHYLLCDVVATFGRPKLLHPAMLRGHFPQVTHVAGKVASLSSAGSDNYYHWLFDVLPRLDLIRLCGIECDKIVVNTATSFQKECLQILGIHNDKIIHAHKKLHVQADRLVAPSLTGHAAPWACDFLRRAFADCMECRGSIRGIYVSRANCRRRRIVNEDEVVALMLLFGFDVLYPEQMFVREQIRAFSSAEIVISAHGAALTNLVFCRPGTKVIELFSPNYVNVCYWILSKEANLRYFYLEGKGRRPPEYQDPHLLFDDIQIDVPRLRQLIEYINGL